MILKDKTKDLLDICKRKGLRIATAESCTGGLVASAITDIPGSSSVFECSFVTYSNQSKTRLLGVDAGLIASTGAVSKEVAGAMAEGAISKSTAELSCAITGIAGPDGGTKNKPVGLVYIATALRGRKTVVKRFKFSGSRKKIRQKSVESAILLLLDRVKP